MYRLFNHLTDVSYDSTANYQPCAVNYLALDSSCGIGGAKKCRHLQRHFVNLIPRLLRDLTEVVDAHAVLFMFIIKVGSKAAQLILHASDSLSESCVVRSQCGYLLS